MAEQLDLLLGIILGRLFRGEFEGSDPNVVARSKLESISRAVARLSQLYTRDRGQLRQNLLQEPDLRLAYLAYFLPSNVFKIHAILREIWLHPAVNHSPERIRILDLGCGPGTQLLGCLNFLWQQLAQPARIECVGVDSLESNLQDTRFLFDRFSAELSTRCTPGDAPPHGFQKANCTLETYRTDLMRPLGLKGAKRFDFIIMANVLNELFAGEDQRIEKRCRRIANVADEWLSPEGFLILMEPALRETSRELLRVRDRLLEMLPLAVYSPCVHNQPCPAVASGCNSDWCHEDHTWEAPDWISQIDAQTGLRKTSLKYSYVVLSRTGFSIRDVAANAAQSGTDGACNHIWRVVSETLDERGKASVYLCGTQGRFRVTRLKRHVSASNKEFDSLDRGQVVSTQGLAGKGVVNLRVEAETTLHIVTGKHQPC